MIKLITINDLPKKIPIFPLSNFIIFPKTTVPLNIFEPQYIDMINDSMKSDKLIGMIQPLSFNNIELTDADLHQVGCLGKISDFQKIKDGRILINLIGVSRFKIIEEISNDKLYREFKVDYQNFSKDTEEVQNEMNTEALIDKAKSFFKRNGLLLNWKEFEKLDQLQKINTLAMIAPVTNEEKQKLLEAISIEDKIKALESIISFYLFETGTNNQTIQ